MEKYYEILSQCALFRQIDQKDIGNLLKCLNSQVKSYQTDEYLFFAGDKVNYVGVVLSGTIEIMKENLAGNKHIVAFLGTGQMFAEGIVCTMNRIAPVNVVAKEEAKVLMIPYERIIKSCGNSCSFHIGLIQNMMVVLGERNVRLNRKLELLTLKGMREKIASYLLSEAEQNGKKIFDILLNRTEMADYLNVSRTSMCRELARMKEDGIIDFYGHSFKILDGQRLGEILE